MGQVRFGFFGSGMVSDFRARYGSEFLGKLEFRINGPGSSWDFGSGFNKLFKSIWFCYLDLKHIPVAMPLIVEINTATKKIKFILKSVLDYFCVLKMYSQSLIYSNQVFVFINYLTGNNRIRVYKDDTLLPSRSDQ